MDSKAYVTGLDDIKEDANEEEYEESFRVNKLNQELNYYRHKMDQLTRDKEHKLSLIQ